MLLGTSSSSPASASLGKSKEFGHPQHEMLPKCFLGRAEQGNCSEARVTPKRSQNPALGSGRLPGAAPVPAWAVVLLIPRHSQPAKPAALEAGTPPGVKVNLAKTGEEF